MAERWKDFRLCPQCGWDPATNEGDHGCAWGDCPNLPEALDVICPDCRLNLFTMSGGNPQCEDPETCPHTEVARSHRATLRAWLEQSPAGAGRS